MYNLIINIMWTPDTKGNKKINKWKNASNTQVTQNPYQKHLGTIFRILDDKQGNPLALNLCD